MNTHIRYGDVLAQVAALQATVNGLQAQVRDLTEWKAARIKIDAKQRAATRQNSKIRMSDDACAAMRNIVEAQAILHGWTSAELVGPGRGRRLTAHRQDAYAACSAAGFSSPQIGAFFGGRDHTTVLHGVVASKKRGAG